MRRKQSTYERLRLAREYTRRIEQARAATQEPPGSMFLTETADPTGSRRATGQKPNPAVAFEISMAFKR